jgi:Family of unknown function (DUF5908)
MVEIKELIVRAIVASPPAVGGGTSTANADAKRSSGVSGSNHDIVEDCVRQVLAILERQKER